MRTIVFFSLFLCFGCHKYHVTCQKQHVGRSSLASTFVKSPDPEQKNPPKGERLIVHWRVPEYAMKDPLTLSVHLIYKDLTQKIERFEIDRRFGYITYELINEEFKKTGGILTYKAEVSSPEKVLESFEQQLWVTLIEPPDIDTL